MSGEERGTSPEVLNYRLQNVEQQMVELKNEVDNVNSLYPTREIVELLMEPLQTTLKGLSDRMSGLENKIGSQDEKKRQERSQIKLILIGAIVSPIVSAMVTLVILGRAGLL